MSSGDSPKGDGMKREYLLKDIAQTGYNIGYAAKKHLATFDIVEKAPGWISIFSFAFGVLAFVVPAFKDDLLAAFLLVVAYAVFYFNSYQDQRGKYAEVGSRLTTLFTKLRAIYYEVQSRGDHEDLDELAREYRAILDESQVIGISKQIFLSDWYAHYKFFWQAQTGWLDEQLHFSFWRDKVPLSATVSVLVALVALSAWIVCKHALGGMP